MKTNPKTPKNLRSWEKEKRLIPVMIGMYCRHRHHPKKGELCPECQQLCDYALFRLDKCPFKVNKRFCSFCRIHCYVPEKRAQIKEVMRFAGPRMVFTHPLFAFKHVFQMIAYKNAQKKKEQADAR